MSRLGYSLIFALILQGCTKAYTQDYQAIPLFYSESAGNYWHSSGARYNASYSEELMATDRRIRAYLRQNPETSAEVVRSLLNYRLSRGMTKSEAAALIGAPCAVYRDETNGLETWILGGARPWSSRVALTFEGTRLVHIRSKTLRVFPY